MFSLVAIIDRDQSQVIPYSRIMDTYAGCIGFTAAKQASGIIERICFHITENLTKASL